MTLDHVSTQQREPCDYCRGTGLIEGETQARGVTEYEPCPNCDGEGSWPDTTDHLMAVTYQAARVASVEEGLSDLEIARRELHQAIREAHQAGHSYRAIAQAAGISHQRVGQILSREGIGPSLSKRSAP